MEKHLNKLIKSYLPKADKQTKQAIADIVSDMMVADWIEQKNIFDGYPDGPKRVNIFKRINYRFSRFMGSDL